MTEPNNGERLFVITSISKVEMIAYFKAVYSKSPKVLREIMKIVNKLSNGDMEKLASKMAEEHINHMFWTSMEHTFEDLFM